MIISVLLLVASACAAPSAEIARLQASIARFSEPEPRPGGRFELAMTEGRTGDDGRRIVDSSAKLIGRMRLGVFEPELVLVHERALSDARHQGEYEADELSITETWFWAKPDGELSEVEVCEEQRFIGETARPILREEGLASARRVLAALGLSDAAAAARGDRHLRLPGGLFYAAGPARSSLRERQAGDFIVRLTEQRTASTGTDSPAMDYTEDEERTAAAFSLSGEYLGAHRSVARLKRLVQRRPPTAGERERFARLLVELARL